MASKSLEGMFDRYAHDPGQCQPLLDEMGVEAMPVATSSPVPSYCSMRKPLSPNSLCIEMTAYTFAFFVLHYMKEVISGTRNMTTPRQAVLLARGRVRGFFSWSLEASLAYSGFLNILARSKLAS